MNNKIENKKTEVPSTIEMNDKDYITAILESEKNMSVNMTYALNEASNEQLYKQLLEIFNKVKQSQRDLYELMFKKGWYSLEQAEETKIAQACNKNKTAFQELDQNNQNLT